MNEKNTPQSKKEIQFLILAILLFLSLAIVQTAKAEEAPRQPQPRTLEDFSHVTYWPIDMRGDAKTDRDEAYIFMRLATDLCPAGEIDLMIATWPEFYIDEIAGTNTCLIPYDQRTMHEDTAGYLADITIDFLEHGFYPIGAPRLRNMQTHEYWSLMLALENAGIEKLYERDRQRALISYAPMIATAGPAVSIGEPPTTP